MTGEGEGEGTRLETLATQASHLFFCVLVGMTCIFCLFVCLFSLILFIGITCVLSIVYFVLFSF